jgi:multisubunit Na+/H+ antiporter MnhG subunit
MIASPVAAHILINAAYKNNEPLYNPSKVDELQEYNDKNKLNDDEQ